MHDAAIGHVTSASGVRSMSSAPQVLLVAPPGPGRRSAARTLKGLGYRVRTAGEPFEGTARFVERAADLVLLSLADFGRRDTAFLHTVRRRAPSCRIVLLVPEGRREQARRALRAGADACLPDPFHAEELVSLVRILAPPPAEVLDLAGESGKAVRVLAREVAHAVNNPLQVLSLLADDAAVPGATRESLVARRSTPPTSATRWTSAWSSSRPGPPEARCR